jgi:hypothetical protein
VQIDGSRFAWLEDRGPQLTLVGAIDDATSQLLALHFRPTEDLHGYARLFQDLFTTHGLPLAVYGDRLNLLVRNDAHWTLAEELAGVQEPTHLGRVLRDLGVAYIAAGSPQAKGRVERLWGTLQDRLVSELRVRAIASAEAANAYLPDFIAAFNRRFARPPAQPRPVWRRPPRDLALVLSCRYRRIVARDNTVRLGARWIQLAPGPHGRSYAGCHVELRELLDGRLVVLHEGVVLASRQPDLSGDFVLKPWRAPSGDRRPPPARPAPPTARRPSAAATLRTHTGRQPLPTHPWMRAWKSIMRTKHRDLRRQVTTFSRSSEG